MTDAPVVVFDVDRYTNGVTITGNGWSCVDQNLGFCNLITTSSTPFSRYSVMATPSTAGNWVNMFYQNFTSYGDYEVSFHLKAPAGAYCYVRCATNNGIFPDGYSLLIPTAGVGTTASLSKVCGGSPYTMLTNASMPSFDSSNCVVRMQIVGLVLSGWINGNFVGSYDFTGNVLCSAATFTTGTFCVTGFGQSFWISPTNAAPPNSAPTIH